MNNKDLEGFENREEPAEYDFIKNNYPQYDADLDEEFDAIRSIN